MPERVGAGKADRSARGAASLRRRPRSRRFRRPIPAGGMWLAFPSPIGLPGYRLRRPHPPVATRKVLEGRYRMLTRIADPPPFAGARGMPFAHERGFGRRPPEPVQPVATAGKSVLVADDEVDIVELLATLLEDEGFNVLRAYDGEQAWGVALRCAPDLVISDVGMPRLDGLDLLRRLRAAASLHRTPVMPTAAPAFCTISCTPVCFSDAPGERPPTDTKRGSSRPAFRRSTSTYFQRARRLVGLMKTVRFLFPLPVISRSLLPRSTSAIVSLESSETRIPVSTRRRITAWLRSGARLRRAASSMDCTCAAENGWIWSAGTFGAFTFRRGSSVMTSSFSKKVKSARRIRKYAFTVAGRASRRAEERSLPNRPCGFAART